MRLKGEKRGAAGGAAAFLRRGMREDGGGKRRRRSEGGDGAGRRRRGGAKPPAQGMCFKGLKRKSRAKARQVKEYACMLAVKGYKGYKGYKKDTERDMIYVPYPRGYQRLRRPMGRQEP